MCMGGAARVEMIGVVGHVLVRLVPAHVAHKPHLLHRFFYNLSALKQAAVVAAAAAAAGET